MERPISRCAMPIRARGIHQQKNRKPLERKIFGDAGCGQWRPSRGEGGLLGSGHDHHRTTQTLGAKVFLDEFPHFAAAFANQTDHVDLTARITRDHSHKSAFPHAAAREDAHALAFATGHHRINGAHTVQSSAEFACASTNAGRLSPRGGWRQPAAPPLPSMGLARASSTRPFNPSLPGTVKGK